MYYIVYDGCRSFDRLMNISVAMVYSLFQFYITKHDLYFFLHKYRVVHVGLVLIYGKVPLSRSPMGPTQSGLDSELVLIASWS